MVLERDRLKSERELQERTWAAVTIEARLLRDLQTPCAFKDTFEGKLESKGLNGDEPPLASLITPEVMKEVDALSWMSLLNPPRFGNALPNIYGHDVALFEKGHLRPRSAEALAANLQLVHFSVEGLEKTVDTAHQRIEEILGRKQGGTTSEFDEEVWAYFLETGGVDPEIGLLQEIQNKKQIFTQEIKPKIERALARAKNIAEELSVYKDIPHEQAAGIVLYLCRTLGPHKAQTLQQAGAEDHILECSHTLCKPFRELYGPSADFTTEERKLAILAKIEESLSDPKTVPV